jgi:membrane protease YdiL (CAAX protease family)
MHASQRIEDRMAAQTDKSANRTAALVETIAFALMHGALAALALVVAGLVLGWMQSVAP